MSEPVRLPASLAAFGTPDLEPTLREELLRHSLEVPLEDFCRGEALPGFDVDLELSVHRTEADPDNCYITAFISFTGRAPSYCADHNHVEPADGFLRLTLNRRTGAARFETDPLG